MSDDRSERRTTCVLWSIVAACAVFVLLYALGIRPFSSGDNTVPEADFDEDEYADVLLQPATVDDMKYAVEFDRNVAPDRESEDDPMDADLIQPESKTGGLSATPMEELNL